MTKQQGLLAGLFLWSGCPAFAAVVVIWAVLNHYALSITLLYLVLLWIVLGLALWCALASCIISSTVPSVDRFNSKLKPHSNKLPGLPRRF
jgi:hypothetical protein